MRYPGFATGQVILNLFIDNSFLLVVAVGMTFVILTGGIDLSVGSVVALSTLLSRRARQARLADARRDRRRALIGSALGSAMGCVIHYFEIQPFIVTLAGMFLARGLCYAITVDADLDHQPGYVAIAEHSLHAARRHVRDDRGASSRSSPSRSGSTSCTTRGSAAPSTRSAATRSRRC